MMRPPAVFLLCLLIFVCETSVAEAPIGSESKACITCHLGVTPGIVGDWQTSRHAAVTPSDALQQDKSARRISISDVNDRVDGNAAVSCFECHGLNTADHADSFSHYGFTINVIVTPKDCAACHPVEVDQYSGSKKAHAVDNLRKNSLYSLLVETIISPKTVADSSLHMGKATDSSKAETCYACHGTDVRVEGSQTIQSRFGPVDVPNLTNWPNQGVGRINPDGSLGACTACHPRHSFSIEIARSPATCGQCHLEPDVPAYNVYKESKHGNIYDVKKPDWNMDAVPWKIGIDLTAPTCATCHVSLLTDQSGQPIANRSHNFASRLWTRLFGLIVSHPQPKNGRTFTITNADGLPLPTTFSGVPAAEFLISEKEQQNRQDTMKRVCVSCHSTSWAENYLSRLKRTIDEVDSMILAATDVVEQAWQSGQADSSNPFDELIEFHWLQQWLFYANSVKYASAMMGPDYASFKNGWWELTKNLLEMGEMVNEAR